MPLIILITITFVGLLLWALYTERPPPVTPRSPLRPWQGLPTAADIRQSDFPLVALGYDRAAVEQHLARTADAYESLRLATQAADQAGARDQPDQPMDRAVE